VKHEPGDEPLYLLRKGNLKGWRIRHAGANNRMTEKLKKQFSKPII
jgi:hypothetical protein